MGQWCDDWRVGVSVADRARITRMFRTIVATTEPALAFATLDDGTVIAWSSVGEGPALIHLPGVPCSSRAQT
jgi:hypothetical protein